MSHKGGQQARRAGGQEGRRAGGQEAGGRRQTFAKAVDSTKGLPQQVGSGLPGGGGGNPLGLITALRAIIGESEAIKLLLQGLQ